MNRKLSMFLVSFMLLAGFGGCSKDENDPDVIVRNSIALTASQQVPAATTSGSGELHMHYKRSNRTLTYTITWTGLTSTVTGIHFHGPAVSGQLANTALDIVGFATPTTGTSQGSVVVAEAQVNDFLAGKWYLDIHTANNPLGEIRGQVQP